MTVRVFLIIILLTLETLSTPYIMLSFRRKYECRILNQQRIDTQKHPMWPHFKYKRNNYRLVFPSLACVAFNASVIANKIRRPSIFSTAYLDAFISIPLNHWAEYMASYISTEYTITTLSSSRFNALQNPEKKNI